MKCIICNGDDSLGMVTCRGCGVTVHIDEYEASWESGASSEENWFCFLCDENGKSRPDKAPKCVLCLQSTFKFPYLKVKENDDFGPNAWAHFHCVSFLPETWQDVDSKAVVDLDLRNKLPAEEAYWKIRKERVDLQCIVCKKNGWRGKSFRSACVQCSHETCSDSFHVTCALVSKSSKFLSEVDVSTSTYKLYCPHHSSVKKFAVARDKTNKNNKKRKKDATDVETVLEGEANSSGDTNRSKKKTKTSGSSSNAVGLLNSEATSQILAMQHKTDKTFCTDDMRKIVPLLFKCTNVNSQIQIIESLRNSSFLCVQAFLSQPYPKHENFIVNSSKIPDTYRPSQYGGLIAICNWIYYQQRFGQMDRPKLFYSFLCFIEELNISVARYLVYKVGALYKATKDKVRLKKLMTIVKSLADKSDKSNIRSKAKHLCELWAKEHNEISAELIE
eukprot:g3050.t1